MAKIIDQITFSEPDYNVKCRKTRKKSSVTDGSTDPSPPVTGQQYRKYCAAPVTGASGCQHSDRRPYRQDSYFLLLETGRIRQNLCKMRNETRLNLFNYIEFFYNPTRGHGNNNGVSPAGHGKQYVEKLL